MSADALALLDPSTPDTWPQGILAAADLREQRAKAATPGPWVRVGLTVRVENRHGQSVTTSGRHAPGSTCDWHAGGSDSEREANAEHIAAEANPAHALAAVRRWRGVVERHWHDGNMCRYDAAPWPCMDIRETADEARAYLGGAR